MKQKSISAFFPMYNDEGTVKLMYDKLTKILSKYTKDYEIIMVNDCSPDKSGDIAEEIAKKDKHVKVIHHEKNKGYGGALQSGFKACTKELIFYTDGDAQYDVYELDKLMPHINDYALVNGYKIKRNDPFYRKLVGTTYQHIIKYLFKLKVKDVDCDFRLIKKEVMDKINLIETSGLVCTELVKKIEMQKVPIINIPVHHYRRIHGKSQFFKPRKLAKTIKDSGKRWYNMMILKKED